MKPATILVRETTLRRASNDLSIAELEQLIVNVNKIIKEKKNKEALQQQKSMAKTKTIEQIRKQMSDAGIDVSELNGTTKAAPIKKKKATKKKSKVVPGYEVKDKEGKVHQWSGRGRPPAAFKAAIEGGKTKEQLRIKK